MNFATSYLAASLGERFTASPRWAVFLAARSRCWLWVLLAMLVVAAGCRSPFYADRGAGLGGLLGAATGAAIGGRGGHPLAGAAVGAAAGAVTGEAIGEGIDADIAGRQAQIQAQTQAQMGRQMAGAVTTTDVISMTQAGLADEVIASHIRANGVAHRPQVGDLISLKNQGVSDSVIQAMQQAPGPQPVAAGVGPPPMIMEGVVARPYPPPWMMYGPPLPRYWRRPGLGWGFSFWD